MLKALRAAPAPVLWLGLGGLLPFLALGACVVGAPREPAWVAELLVGYGALIVTFVGALQWGLAMRAQPEDPRDQWWLYGWGVTPSLLAWVALMLPPRPALLLLAPLFVAAWCMDLRAVRRHGAPDWYLPLRTLLSTLVTLTLLLAALTL